MNRKLIALVFVVLSALLLAQAGGAAANGDASPLGTLFRLNQTTANDQSVNGVDFDAAGGFVAVWSGQYRDDCCLNGQDPPDIIARQFDENGQPKGDEFVVNDTAMNGYQTSPIVGVAPNGTFLVTYFDSQFDRICARHYSATGTPSGPDPCLAVNSQAAVMNEFYDMNMSPNGEHVAVVFTDYRNVYVQSLTGEGQPVNGNEVLVVGDAGLWEDPAIAVDDDGDFVVVWQKEDVPGCNGGMMAMARRYNANKVPQGDAFEVVCDSMADVAMDSSGKFVIVWSAFDGDSDIFARRFKANGTPDGSAFAVNQNTAKSQDGPNAAMNAAGDLFITWKQSETQIWGIPIDWPIMGRLFPATGPAGNEYRVSVYRGDNPLGNRSAIDDDGRPLAVWVDWGQDGSNYGSYGQFGQPVLPDVDILLSTAADGKMGNLRYARGDILRYDRPGGVWSIYFDASDHGLTGDMADFAQLPGGDMLFILKKAATLPGAGLVQPQDVIRYNAAAGDFSLYMDGSDVDLTKKSESLDALAIDADGSLLLSLTGSGAMGGITALDQDIIRFTPTETGPNTTGDWSMVLPGLGYNMPKDTMTLWADTAGDDLYFYMTFDRTVKVSNDYKIPRGTIMRCRPYYPWAGTYSSCLIDLYWNAHEAGLPAKAKIDGLELLVGD